jgi:DNA polymerase-3 subunit beta
MELSIEKKDLAKVLSRAVPACAPKSPMTILTHVKLSAEKNGTVTAFGTDLTLSVTAATTGEVKKPGVCCVSARQFSDIVRALPLGVAIKLAVKDNRLEIKSGKSHFKVPCLSADDYPVIPQPEKAAPRLRVQSGLLAKLISGAAYARESADESRAFIACVRVEHSAGALKCVATDSKRLAFASAKVERDGDWGADHIHARAISDVKKLCEELADCPVDLSVNGGLEGYMHFEWDGVTLSSKSAGSNFVPYQNLMQPYDGGKKVDVAPRTAAIGREELIEALKRVSLVAAERGASVRCELLPAGSIFISSETASKGAAVEEVALDSFEGDGLVFGVNPQFFVEALQTFADDTVLLKMGGVRDPMLIVGAADESASMAVLMLSYL